VIELAKHQLDIGLTTEDRDETLAFWQNEVGLAYDGPLSVGGGVQQHRHSFRGSIVKINHSRNPLEPEPPSGYRQVFVAQPDRTEVLETSDPGGNRVTLVPPGYEGISQLGVEVGVRDVAEHARFWGEIVGLPEAPRSGEHAFRVGDSVLRLVHDPDAPSDSTRRGTGYRYCTLQVFDADAEYRRCIVAGARAGHEPFTHGDVARYGFIRDPDGNWIELSQRASITGPLPQT
jgi:lactoylglutathione lyase